MNHKNDDLNRFLPNQKLDPDHLSVEIPAEQPIAPDRIPSAFDPMGEIHLRGQAYRGLAGGRIPWWILISGWFMFGSIAAVLLHAAIASQSLTIWLLLLVGMIPLIILWRGTMAKLSSRNQPEK